MWLFREIACGKKAIAITTEEHLVFWQSLECPLRKDPILSLNNFLDFEVKARGVCGKELYSYYTHFSTYISGAPNFFFLFFFYFSQYKSKIDLTSQIVLLAIFKTT